MARLEIEMDVSCILGEADVDGALGRVKLRPRFEQIEILGDRLRAYGASRGLVVAPTQPGAKALAADWPCFPVTIDQEIGERGAGGGVEQLATRRDLGEHGGCRQAGASVSTAASPTGFEV
jgi:hypothetical protein